MTTPGQPHDAVTPWSALRRADPEALELTGLEAHELARVLAVENIASDLDAELDELGDRLRHLERTAWPDDPLADFRLQSSLGTFVIANVAIAWVPTGQVGLRRRPHGPEELARGLMQQGVEPSTARSVVGEWLGPPDAFEGDLEGLGAGTLAGLAERSLTPEERERALAQVAVSPRDLSRLAATLVLGRSVRRLMPVLPDEALGGTFAAALALVATDRGGRALELLAEEPDHLRVRTVRELAEGLAALQQGEVLALDDDVWAPVPDPHAAFADVAEEEPQTAPGEDLPAEASSPPDAEDLDDVLAIVEEVTDPDAELSAEPDSSWTRPGLPAAPRWWPAGPGDASGAWARLGARRSRASGRRGLLGISFPPLELRGGPIPADERLAGADGPDVPAEEEARGGAPALEGEVVEPFLPAARSALRVILAAARGHPPPPGDGGGLDWVFDRAAALAEVAGEHGELEVARGHLLALSDAQAPERRWIRDRQVRYQGRTPAPLTPEEVAAWAATLVLDLARSLARTLTEAPALESTREQN